MSDTVTNYKTIEQLGRNTYSTTYKVLDSLGRAYVLKSLDLSTIVPYKRISTQQEISALLHI